MPRHEEFSRLLRGAFCIMVSDFVSRPRFCTEHDLMEQDDHDQ